MKSIVRRIRHKSDKMLVNFKNMSIQLPKTQELEAYDRPVINYLYLTYKTSSISKIVSELNMLLGCWGTLPQFSKVHR